MHLHLWLLFYLLQLLSGQGSTNMTANALNISSYLGLSAETAYSQSFSFLDGESESEVEKVSRALLEPRQGRVCSAGPGGRSSFLHSRDQVEELIHHSGLQSYHLLCCREPLCKQDDSVLR